MQHDIWKFSCLLLAAAGLGYAIGFILPVMLLMAISIIAWQVFRLHGLQDWLQNPKKNSMPQTSGQFYEIYRNIKRKTDKSEKRKTKLSTFFTQFRQAINALPDAIVLITDNGKIEWANSNAESLLGIRWPEDTGMRFTDLIRYPEVADMLAMDELPIDGVVVNSLSDAERTFSIKAVRYTKDLRMVIARDVSRLIELNQIHSDFVANVSHELKTPLTVLRGYVEILQNMTNVPETFGKPLQQMSQQSIRMQMIVNDLLYLAKLEDHSGEQVKEPVSIAHIVNTVSESLQPLIEEKRHTLELDIDYSLNILGATNELHSAIANLITNAIHYTPANGLIKIKWAAHGAAAIFSVKDNGLGIPARHIERLTQRFYRVDNDRSRESGGTGLGLAIVKHVLQRHEAELEIDSIEGVGSEFKFHFADPYVLSTNNDAAKHNG